MAPVTMGKQKESAQARILGSGTAGISELLIFHPVDTVAKRLMSNTSKGIPIKEVVFKKHAEASIGRKFLSLFPGFGYAAGYKVLQRVYKFGGQPFVNDFLNANYKQHFTNAFGQKNGKAMTSATAGSIIGIGEVVLLPLDRLKIMRQTNPEAFRGRGLFKILGDEGLSLYAGTGWTIARNAPGSFALFGGSAFTKDYIFHLQDYSAATWGQNFVASVAGSISSIAISQPLDVIKTRIQNANFENRQSGFTVIRELIKHEGPSAFFKGLTPKLLSIAPKLSFSFWVAQSLIPFFGKYM